MIHRTCIALVLATASLALGACNSGRGAGGGGGSGPMYASDAAGEEVLRGVVRIANVERAADGSVTYYLENISGKVQEDLAYRVDFSYRPTGQGAIDIREDHEVTPEHDLVLLKSDANKAVTVANPRPGSKVEATKITVEDTPPVPAVTRSGNDRGTGTLLLNGALEIVRMASPDEIRAGQLWIEVENRSDRPATELEAKAVFTRGPSKKAETSWASASDVPPGGTGRIHFDISGLGQVDTYDFLVKVRQQSL